MKTPFATAVLTLALLAPLPVWPQVSLSINIAPPPLPVYTQPMVPGDGYLWTPGYWAWDPADNDYFWVPGTWVLAPTPGYLWTPGYWGYGTGGFRWNVGYWGPRVGFYGGIAYGHGYNGRGYDGGRWQRGAFHYNTTVNNVNKTVVRNVYNTKVVTHNTVNITRVSYNGGGAGVHAQPTAVEQQARREKHTDATPNQVEHERTAMRTPSQKASVNRGAPDVAATPRAAAFDAPQAVKASNPARAARADGPDADHKSSKADNAAQRDRADAREPKAPPAPDQSRADVRTPAPQTESTPQRQGERPAKGKDKDAPSGATGQTRPDAEPQAKGHAPQDAQQAHAQGEGKPKGKPQRE